MNTSLAAFFDGPGTPFQLRDVPLPILEPGEILARVVCCTICGSDLHTASGRRTVPTPCILGHEIVAEIYDLRGSDICDLRGAPLDCGDRIVWGIVRACQTCPTCRQGLPQKCEHGRKFGHQVDNPEWRLCGGLAEFCHLPADTSIVKVNTVLADHALCPASCGTATVAAAIRQAGPLLGRRILILGAGLLGLTTAAMSAEAAPQSVTVCDPDEDRLRSAVPFGASETITWPEFGDRIGHGRPDESFDVVFEMSGQADAVEASLAAAGIGARVILVGSVRPTRSARLDAESVVRRCLRIAGVHNYAPDDLVTAVEFLERVGTERPFAELVASSFSLSEVDAAFRCAHDTRAVRIAVHP